MSIHGQTNNKYEVRQTDTQALAHRHPGTGTQTHRYTDVLTACQASPLQRKDIASFQIDNGERRHVMCVGARSGSNQDLGVASQAL